MRKTMQAVYENALECHDDRVAIRFEDDAYSYRELERWSRAVALQLLEADIGLGDPVALYMANTIEFIVVDIAIARIGAVKVPINYMLSTESVHHIVKASRAKAIVSDGAMLARLSQEFLFNDSIHILQVKTKDLARLPYAQWLVELPPEGAPTTALGDSGATPESVAAIYFTGGTTGTPKGVVHTQASTVALQYAQMLEGEITESDRLLLMTPLAHAAGLFVQSAIIRGATVLLYNGFKAETAVSLITSGRATWSFLVPTMIYRLLDLLGDVPSINHAMRTIVYGAAPIAPARIEQALRVLGPIFIQLYGQAESPNWGTRLTKADHLPHRPDQLASCGRPSIMAEVKIVDTAGNCLPPGKTGEICLRTPYMLKEYLDDDKATQEKFLGDWIRTGDIGELSDRGYLYLRDRKSDMVISGGMNVYSREVEDVLSAHPEIKTVAVIGIPHDDWGEAVHAIVVPHENSTLDEPAVLAWAREHCATYARPKSVEFRESLPETPFGKIDKKMLRAPYWENAERSIN